VICRREHARVLPSGLEQRHLCERNIKWHLLPERKARPFELDTSCFVSCFLFLGSVDIVLFLCVRVSLSCDTREERTFSLCL
jgi:hypothetical protein